MEEVDGSNPSRSTTTFQTPTSLPVTNHDSGAIQTLCVAAAHPERANGTAAAVLDAVTRHDVVPHHLRQFLAHVRPVHPGGDEDGDGLTRNTGRLQGLEQERLGERDERRPVRPRRVILGLLMIWVAPLLTPAITLRRAKIARLDAAQIHHTIR